MQQYAGIYLLQNYSACFGCLSHPLSGVHKTVTAASGTGYITYLCNKLPPTWPNYATLAEGCCFFALTVTLVLVFGPDRGFVSWRYYSVGGSFVELRLLHCWWYLCWVEVVSLLVVAVLSWVCYIAGGSCVALRLLHCWWYLCWVEVVTLLVVAVLSWVCYIAGGSCVALRLFHCWW